MADQGKDMVIEGAQDLQDKVSSELVPGVEHAVDNMRDQFHEVKKHSEKSLKEAAKQVKKQSAETLGKPKPKRGRKTLLFLVLAAVAGCVGYLLYRRSQPVDDPWAEEYWEDVEVSEFDPQEAAEKAQDKAKEVAENVAEKADEAVDAVKDKVEK
ncbi:hypothetical protein [uncultured Varibaculum sp.]|uniref:hypothetical protein n=1 Tax=uncultured Varibaculum sp. TaxID=413896 RepID=UPI00288B1D8C|nr:hypothetical protein [uncultured Varibaculum sp.]